MKNHSLKLPKSARLVSRRDFSRVFKFGKKIQGNLLLIHILDRVKEKKLGISASRRYGDAVERNRFKRIVREAYRLSYNELPNVHLNVTPRPDAKEATTDTIINDLTSILKIFLPHSL